MKIITSLGIAVLLATLTGCVTVPSGGAGATEFAEIKRWYRQGDTTVNLAEAIALLRQPSTPVSVRVVMESNDAVVSFPTEKIGMWRHLVESNTNHQHVLKNNKAEGLVYTFYYTFDPVSDAPVVGQSSRYKSDLFLTYFFEDKTQFSLGSAEMIMDTACLDMDLVQLAMARELIGLVDRRVTGNAPHLSASDDEFISLPWDSDRMQADCAAGTTADSLFAS